jgi:hypothetical protein
MHYVLTEFEGVEGGVIAAAVEKAHFPKLEIALISPDALAMWTSLSPEEVTQEIWKHNNGLLCESRIITEDEYDALC